MDELAVDGLPILHRGASSRHIVAGKHHVLRGSTDGIRKTFAGHFELTLGPLDDGPELAMFARPFLGCNYHALRCLIRYSRRIINLSQLFVMQLA